LGKFLHTLHEIEVTGFGRLVEKPRVIAGRKDTHISGLMDRWCWAGLWPYDDAPLANHAIAKLRPDALSRLELFGHEIAGLARVNHVSLVHSDLHGEHIFESNGHLSGVIDFGAAFVGLPAWDFGSIAFYHGWDTAIRCMNGYSSTAVQDIGWQARLMSLVIALYKLARADSTETSQAKVQRILKFIDETLSAI
jgi:5-methylthioribose kinase